MELLDAFKNISDVVIDAYFVVDKQGQILEYNRAFFAMFPRQVARKLKGMPIAEAVLTERNVALECMEAGRHVRLDEIPLQVSGSDESYRVIVSGIPLEDDAGEVFGALVIIRNVTDEAMMQVKYQEMLETEARERERLSEQIKERTSALVETNDLLLDLQRELMDYKKGLQL
jgi:PAS domain S-box-containing protein